MSVQRAVASLAGPVGGAHSTRQINAVVVSAGLMEKTVKVRIGVQKWNNHIRKHFSHTQHLLVHDPASSVRIGDIVSISPGYRASKKVHHVVSSILAPFGEPIESRPPIPTPSELIAAHAAKMEAKALRRAEVHGRDHRREKLNADRIKRMQMRARARQEEHERRLRASHGAAWVEQQMQMDRDVQRPAPTEWCMRISGIPATKRRRDVFMFVRKVTADIGRVERTEDGDLVFFETESDLLQAVESLNGKAFGETGGKVKCEVVAGQAKEEAAAEQREQTEKDEENV